MTILYRTKAKTLSTRLAAIGLVVTIGAGLASLAFLNGKGTPGGAVENAPVSQQTLSAPHSVPDHPQNAQATGSPIGLIDSPAIAASGTQFQAVLHKIGCLRNRKHWREVELQDSSQLPEEAKETLKAMRSATETMCADASERDELQLKGQIRELASAGDAGAKVFLLRERLLVARATAHNYLGPNARGDTVAPGRPDVEQDLRELRTLADAGNRDAMRILGEVLINGALTSRDEVSSFTYQYLANHPDAQTPEERSQELAESVPTQLRAEVEKRVAQTLSQR